VVYKLNKKFSKIVHSYVPKCDMEFIRRTFDWAMGMLKNLFDE